MAILMLLPDGQQIMVDFDSAGTAEEVSSSPVWYSAIIVLMSASTGPVMAVQHWPSDSCPALAQ